MINLNLTRGVHFNMFIVCNWWRKWLTHNNLKHSCRERRNAERLDKEINMERFFRELPEWRRRIWS